MNKPAIEELARLNPIFANVDALSIGSQHLLNAITDFQVPSIEGGNIAIEPSAEEVERAIAMEESGSSTTWIDQITKVSQCSAKVAWMRGYIAASNVHLPIIEGLRSPDPTYTSPDGEKWSGGPFDIPPKWIRDSGKDRKFFQTDPPIENPFIRKYLGLQPI